MPRDGALWALLVLLFSAAAEVPPPENVTVSCQNAAVAVSWDYPEHQPATLFRVSAALEGNDILDIETSERHYDLTPVVWDRQKYYLEYLSVQITASQGGAKSKKEHSNSFSFNSLKVVDTSCPLEFPPVEIEVEAGKATVSFPNPIQHYQELKRTITEDSEPHLSFTVSLVGSATAYGDYSYSCSAKDITCKVDVSLPNDEELCVKLKGILFDSREMRQVEFRETNQTCAPDSDGSHEVTVAIILTAGTICLLIVAAIFICKAKAWTMKPDLNPILEWKDNNQAVGYCTVPKELIDRVSICPPPKSASSTSEDDEAVSCVCSDDSSDHGDPLYQQRAPSESSSQTDSDSAHCSAKMDCDSIEAEDEAGSRSVYDSPHVRVEDMGDRDFVTVYEKHSLDC